MASLFPGNQVVGRTLTRLPGCSAGQIALTFDDGPDPAVTPRVLDLLDRHHARASFFMIGTRAAAHPALVREVVRRGHHVENHTMRHLHGFALLGLRRQRRELAEAQDTLAQATGRAPVLARTPAGIRSPLTDPVLYSLGLRHASWTRRGLDTRSADPELVLHRLTWGIAGGDVLMLHDGNSAQGTSGRPLVLDVLSALLPMLDHAGLRSIPVAHGLTAAGGATPAQAAAAAPR